MNNPFSGVPLLIEGIYQIDPEGTRIRFQDMAKKVDVYAFSSMAFYYFLIITFAIGLLVGCIVGCTFCCCSCCCCRKDTTEVYDLQSSSTLNEPLNPDTHFGF